MLWACLHFPLHLAIIGVVEGSQQIALGRYIFKNLVQLQDYVISACVVQHLDGIALRDTLIANVKTFGLADKLESRDFATVVLDDLYLVANQTGICSVASLAVSNPDGDVPQAFRDFFGDVFSGLYQSTGVKLPQGVNPESLAQGAFLTIYVFYWSSIIMLMIVLAALMWLTKNKEHRPKIFDTLAIYGRLVGCALGLVGGTVAASTTALNKFIASPGILPTCATILFVVIVFDWIGRQLAKKRSRDVWIEADEGNFRGQSADESTA